MAMIYKSRNLANIAKLADNTRYIATKWHEYCEKHGIQILIYETIRSKETQARYVAKGVSQTYRSYHIVGQALDFVLVDSKGTALWNGYNSPQAKLAIAEAKRLGFTWGADWDNDGSTADESFIDSPHLQYEYKGYGTDTFGKKVTVSVSVLKPTATLKAKPKAKVPAKAIKVVGKIKVDKVNNFTYIYSKPADTSTVVGKAVKNVVLPISGSVKGWYEVIHEGKRAYVKAKYATKP